MNKLSYGVCEIKLTSREKELLHCLASGNNIKQTILSLDISKRTLRFHKENVLKKLNCKTLYQALYYFSFYDIDSI